MMKHPKMRRRGIMRAILKLNIWKGVNNDLLETPLWNQKNNGGKLNRTKVGRLKKPNTQTIAIGMINLKS